MDNSKILSNKDSITAIIGEKYYFANTLEYFELFEKDFKNHNIVAHTLTNIDLSGKAEKPFTTWINGFKYEFKYIYPALKQRWESWIDAEMRKPNDGEWILGITSNFIINPITEIKPFRFYNHNNLLHHKLIYWMPCNVYAVAQKEKNIEDTYVTLEEIDDYEKLNLFICENFV